MGKGFNGFRMNKSKTRAEVAAQQAKQSLTSAETQISAIGQMIKLNNEAVDTMKEILFPFVSLLKDKGIFTEDELNSYIRSYEEQQRNEKNELWNKQYGYRDVDDKEVAEPIDIVCVRYTLVMINEDGIDGPSDSRDEVSFAISKPLFLKELGEELVGKKIGHAFEVEGTVPEDSNFTSLRNKKIRVTGCVLRIKKKIKQEGQKDESK